MIVSASVRTDVPAFYGEWFVNRLRAGFCGVLNPYSGKPYRVSLEREDVDGIVFWTKDVGPFMKRLHEVKGMGYPFVVSHTITGNPRVLERSVVDAEKAVANLRRIADEFGERVCVWRYDPIVFSTVSRYEDHVRRFEILSEALIGAVDEVVVSVMHPYAKVRRSMDEVAKLVEDGEGKNGGSHGGYGLKWWDPSDDVKMRLISELDGIAKGRGMQLKVCTGEAYRPAEVVAAKCIDVGRMSDVAGHEIKGKERGTREGCLCDESRDIGMYDTCPHGCVYCYATNDMALVTKRFKGHDPEGRFLYRLDRCVVDEVEKESKTVQLGLFGEL
ncbi:hypothetical protein KS4_07120 [Poriferisphaera corsica]|uniref:DUF1848 domain-containing protein n=1 Tax=Poriferisphaera corsica TaxID=2528020 RepID=A0A517YR26_9BACT|nr:DUF1848 domain-containing protein [Poriferisphaera corsica]QDU32678.1 hypothetical protein KS4_07120 [Poriferisphaera corsica]